MRLILIGCSKRKHACKHDPRRGGRVTPVELYAGQLFRKRVEYAERIGAPWMVLSAEYGLWRPDTTRKPYDVTMAEKSPAELAIWHVHVAYRILHELWEPAEADASQPVLRPNQLTVEIHAGKAYAEPLATILRSLGVSVALPCKGLGIGQQLAMYSSGALAA